jgi:NADH dehydrogenase
VETAERHPLNHERQEIMVKVDHLPLHHSTAVAPDPGADPRPHVVIIGGGFAGLAAAKSLRRTPVRITLLDKRNFHLFQPLLYQVATAYLAPAEIAYPIRSILRRQSNISVLMSEAHAIDLAARTVTVDHGVLEYDYLIIAAGARGTYFGHNAWQQEAPALKSIEDALDIRRRVLHAFERAELEPDEARRRQALTFVVVGGGPTGVELAGALAELSRQTLHHEYRAIDPATARIILVEGGQRILDTYPESLSQRATRALNQLGVEVRTGTRATDIAAGRVDLGGEEIRADTVLWAAGVEGEAIGSSLGLALLPGKRIPANPDLTIEEHPEVFAVGDINGTLDPKGRPYPGVAQVAIQQGKRAGKNIALQVQGKRMKPFHYFDKGNMATIGRNKAIAQIGPLHLSGFPAWVIWAFIHIISLIGFRNRVTVFATWVWSYLTSGRSSRLITRTAEAVAKHETAHVPNR